MMDQEVNCGRFHASVLLIRVIRMEVVHVLRILWVGNTIEIKPEGQSHIGCNCFIGQVFGVTGTRFVSVIDQNCVCFVARLLSLKLEL